MKHLLLLATIAILLPVVASAGQLNGQFTCTSELKAGLSFEGGKWAGGRLEAGAQFTVSVTPSDLGEDLYLISLTDISGMATDCLGQEDGGTVQIPNERDVLQCGTWLEEIKINLATRRFTLFQTAGYIEDDADGYMPPSVEGGTCAWHKS